jgi:hypothetical protein
MFVPPAVLVFGLGAGGMSIEALRSVRRIELSQKALVDEIALKTEIR